MAADIDDPVDGAFVPTTRAQLRGFAASPAVAELPDGRVVRVRQNRDSLNHMRRRETDGHVTWGIRRKAFEDFAEHMTPAGESQTALLAHLRTSLRTDPGAKNALVETSDPAVLRAYADLLDHARRHYWQQGATAQARRVSVYVGAARVRADELEADLANGIQPSGAPRPDPDEVAELAGMLLSAPRIPVALLGDIGQEPGLLAFYRSECAHPIWVGTATGRDGLRRRVRGQHLDPTYLTDDVRRGDPGHARQLRHGIKRNGKPVVEKSVFRSAVAVTEDLPPGRPTVAHIMDRYDLSLLSVTDVSAAHISAAAKWLIIDGRPWFNTNHNPEVHRGAGGRDWSIAPGDPVRSGVQPPAESALLKYPVL